MDFDVYNFGSPLGEVSELAREVEDLGFSGMWFTEAKHNPFLGCALAGAATERMVIGTAIAVAFPRSPMVTAQVAWDLAALSGGRFILGLGTQVKAHMERRFSTPFEHPVAKLREYVLALSTPFTAAVISGRWSALRSPMARPEPGAIPRTSRWLAQYS
jgi:alkanesulfonate monooxygenase SsuD/methylene tetrahydromethanopterin reductase-like flavin-dependent oxidoreductase (luciferase family)